MNEDEHESYDELLARQQAAREMARQLYESGDVNVGFAIAAVLEIALERRQAVVRTEALDDAAALQLSVDDAGQAIGALFHHFGAGNIAAIVRDWTEKHDSKTGMQ